MLKHWYFGYVIWGANSLEKTLILGKIKGRSKSGWQRMRWLDGITDSMDMNLSKLWETVKDRKAWHAEFHMIANSWTWLSNWKTTMFNSSIIIIANEATKCPLPDELIKKTWCTCTHTHTHTHTHTGEYYSVLKREWYILPLSGTWMDLEGVMLSEINQTEKDKYCMIYLKCEI